MCQGIITTRTRPCQGSDKQLIVLVHSSGCALGRAKRSSRGACSSCHGAEFPPHAGQLRPIGPNALAGNLNARECFGNARIANVPVRGRPVPGRGVPGLDRHRDCQRVVQATSPSGQGRQPRGGASAGLPVPGGAQTRPALRPQSKSATRAPRPRPCHAPGQAVLTGRSGPAGESGPVW